MIDNILIRKIHGKNNIIELHSIAHNITWIEWSGVSLVRLPCVEYFFTYINVLCAAEEEPVAIMSLVEYLK